MAIAAVAILVVGTLLKPDRPASDAVISEAERVRLQRLTQRSSLENISSYLAATAQAAAVSVVRWKEIESSGVVWDDQGHVVSSVTDLNAPPAVTAIQPEETPVSGTLTKLDGRMNAAVYTMDPRRFEPATQALPDQMQVGEWLVSVWRTTDGSRAFAPATYLSRGAVTCAEHEWQEVRITPAPGTGQAGGGIFNLEGQLVAVIIQCGARYIALAPSVVNDLILTPPAPVDRIWSRYGFRARQLDEGLSRHFRVREGVLISEVAKGSIFDAAGLSPGDVIRSTDGRAIVATEDLEGLASNESPAPSEVVVQRNGRALRVTLSTPGSGTANSGISLDTAESGYLVQRVDAGSRAAKAGLQSGDRWIRIAGPAPVPFTSTSAAKVLNDGKPIYMIVERDSRRLGIFLP